MSNKKITHRPIDPAVLALATAHKQKAESVLEIFTQLQAERGALAKDTIIDVAQALHIPAERAMGIATFYSMLQFSQEIPLTKKRTLRVCDGPVCWLKDASQLHKAVEQSIAEGTDIKLERTSCLGLCDRAPAALFDHDQAGPILPHQAQDLLHGFLGKPTDYSIARPGELRVMMAKAGLVDSDSVESALENGGYCGLAEALRHKPEEVIAEVESSGLTGRGGAGFPVGRKWRFVAQAPRTPKYIVCNADESEPLIFKDRVLIDTNPHQILEGMAIAGYATGAQDAFIYIRGEYSHQAERLENAIHQAESKGWLGENIQGGGYSFRVHVHRGAGAYICGEETALLESLEGKRGEPRNRPPYPPSAGYFQQPTLVNNVESFAAVPSIMCNGSAWYRSLSSYSTAGTKMYMILGHIQHPGLFEAPFGLTLRRIIDEFAGGMRPGSSFHFALTGGAAGTIVGPELLDIPIDYASAAKGVSLGAGSFLICDQSTSPVAFLRELLHFFRIESCGKCTPCRIGTQRAHNLLVRLAAQSGEPGDIIELLDLAQVMQAASFCGLGQSVAIPIRSALNQFEALFRASTIAS